MGRDRSRTLVAAGAVRVIPAFAAIVPARDRCARFRPGPIYKGKPFGYPGGGRPGIIFFNDEGTENGGLTFTGRRREDGTFVASTGMSFDQFNQDEVLTLRYSDDNGRRSTGLTLADPNGRPRLRLMVDSLGAASVEFLDETGAVTARLPER